MPPPAYLSPENPVIAPSRSARQKERGHEVGFPPPALRRSLCNQVRRHKPDKLTRRYDLVFLPESRKMPQVARDEVIGAGRIGTFQEPIVIGIARHFKTPGRYDQVTSVFDELEKLLPESLADFEFRGGKGLRHIPQE